MGGILRETTEGLSLLSRSRPTNNGRLRREDKMKRVVAYEINAGNDIMHIVDDSDLEGTLTIRLVMEPDDAGMGEAVEFYVPREDFLAAVTDLADLA